MTTKKTSKKVSTTIRPLGDRVLVRPMTEEEARGEKNTHFGILLPDTVTKEKSAQGTVVAVGNGRYIDGKIVPITVKKGDIVIFSKYSYDEVESGGEELYLIREDNILAVIE